MNPSPKKQRVDLLLAQARPELSRSRIQAEIMAGKVLVNGHVCDKPGTIVAPDAKIEILEAENPYVSRGGLKLEGALEKLEIEVNNLVVLDVGASTGGFSDCLLKKGARLVYALDVGYGQLASSLRNDPRIVIMERFNIRNLQPGDLPVKADLAVVDVSFISLEKIFPVLADSKIERLLVLVKPQFEVGRPEADRGSGVIRDPILHSKVLNKIVKNACTIGYCCQKITYSKWPGPKGNIEYFAYLLKRGKSTCSCSDAINSIIEETVQEAHNKLSAGKIKDQEGS